MQALDLFNSAVVSPVYYVMFTSLTIIASVIMFKVIHWCMKFHFSPLLHLSDSVDLIFIDKGYRI